MQATAIPTTVRHIPTKPAPYRWTIREYRELGKTGWFHDKKTMLIHGEVYVMTLPSPPHDVTLGLTHNYLQAAFPKGWHVRNQMGLDIGTNNDPGTDLAVVQGSIRGSRSRCEMPISGLGIVCVA